MWDSWKTTKVLLILILVLSLVTLRGQLPLQVDEPSNVVIDENVISLQSLTLKQKIAQMILVYGKDSNAELYQKMLIGGVYLGAKRQEADFNDAVSSFQEKATIPLLVAVDLEGCLNPFENFAQFPSLAEINTSDEAYAVGKREGELLSSLRINVNLAPVLDLKDDILHCRSFSGSTEEVSEKGARYLAGLQEQEVLAVGKHYPGKTLSVDDSHKTIVSATIGEDDLVPFKEAMTNDVSGIMVSHVISSGAVDSEGRPSGVSPAVVSSLRQQFSGLIFSDEVGMLGLAGFYKPAEVNIMYVDLVKAGHDLILNFDRDPKNIYRMIRAVEKAVENGEISEERIDSSVRRILTAKGMTVVE
ncbi:hypothetical protein COV20_02770 [Candidatus Woesearchaeota archaeon CG10_big_fil_rev_8_21_14_0_10_45_16]|nr:MAG: hypothetical protein COV20_02770 [Candidatus Woesearchaeota archaeon CG10_big_fil_rev_8_21_14_0_10_45_16]